MWTKKNTDQDVLFESGAAWFAAPYNLSSITKPKKIKDWEGDQTCYDVIANSVRWSHSRAEKQLEDLSDIALDFTLTAVKGKQTFTTGAKGENLPPTVFHADRDGQLDGEIIQLRGLLDKDGDRDNAAQDAQVEKWRKDKHSIVDDESATLLKQACDLTDSEVLYVRELVRVYDLVRCYMVMWVVDASFKNHINSERTAAIHGGNVYGWADARKCILRTLVDISPEVRLAKFVDYKRPNSETAILFLARQMAARAMMEGDHVPKHRRITLPESVYLNYTVGQMSDREILDYDIPACGDDFTKLHTDGKKWTLTKVKEHVENAHKPVRFQGCTTAITKMLVHIRTPPDDKPAKGQKQKYDRTKEPGKNHSPPKRPYENFKNLPDKLKRPNPDDKYKGKSISNKAQQQLYDDIKNGNCTRCHKSGHWRGSPKCEVKTPHKWETKLDDKKMGYWTGLTVFQGKLGTDLEQRCMEVQPQLEFRPQLLTNRFANFADSESDESDFSLLPLRDISVSSGEIEDSIDFDCSAAEAYEAANATENFEPSTYGSNDPPDNSQQPFSDGPTFEMPRELYYAHYVDRAVQDADFVNDDIPSLGSDESLPSLCFNSDSSEDSCDDGGNNDDGVKNDDHGEQSDKDYWTEAAQHSDLLLSDVSSPPIPEAYGNSSFRGGLAVRATAVLRNPNPGKPELPVNMGLDSYSDVTVANRSFAYDCRDIDENIRTGGGNSKFKQEGKIDVLTATGTYESIPALIASDPNHLPHNCDVLLGTGEINRLDILLDYHRKNPLAALRFGDDCILSPPPSTYMSEVNMLKWFNANSDKPVGHVPYSYKDIDIDPSLPDDVISRLRDINERHRVVFDATKGELPAAADHPPITLKFKQGWRHVHCPEPRWGPGTRPVYTKWAQEQLDTGLYVKSTSPSASRPHAVKKTPPGSPKDVDITKCAIRVCGDYRAANDQLEKSTPTLTNGTDELSKLPGYQYYWQTDHFGMYHAYRLAPGPSRELLAIHTPIGPIEPTRMVFGEKNAGTAASTPVRAALRHLPNDAHLRTALYVDDNAQGSHTTDQLCEGWNDYLDLCVKQKWTLGANKTQIGYPTCTFFGFDVDVNGTRLADKNLDPIERMVPPTDVPETRHTTGVFVQSKSFIDRYAHIVAPITALLRNGKDGKPVPFVWGPEQQQAYDTIRSTLLNGAHLSPPDYNLPFHLGCDASNDGKAAGLTQYSDVPPGTPFTVIDYGPDHTTVRFAGAPEPHPIAHTSENRKIIVYFSKCWSEADRKRAPYYLEADCLLWGLEKSRFWALSSPYTLFAHSDHLPLKWMKKSDKGPVSVATIENLSDLDYTICYIKGPENVLFDSLSRYPMLGPRQLAPIGLAHSVDELLQRLPDRFRDAKKVQVHAPPHTAALAKRVQAWRRLTNPIDTHSVSHLEHPGLIDLIIMAPRAEDSPRITARILSTTVPFAALIPTDLVPQITTPVDGQPDLGGKYKEAGKISFLESEMLWFIGNIPELSNHCEIYANLKPTAAPLLEFRAAVLPDLPLSQDSWRDAQADDDDLLDGIDEGNISNINGLSTFVANDFPSLIIVPAALREPLVRQHHADLHHLSHTKVLSSLRRHYYWPTMKTDVRIWLNDCEYCENEKAKRRLAHGMHSARPTTGPRSRYCMDFQGQGQATTGEREALAIIDDFTKTVFVLALPDRTAETLTPHLLDEIYFRRGRPDIIHSDAAKEFLSKLFTAVAKTLHTAQTNTLGHNAQGNAELEQWWRFWNRCLRILSPAQYLDWPRYAQRICWAYNTAAQAGLGDYSPFELDHGTQPRSPFTLQVFASPIFGPDIKPNSNIDFNSNLDFNLDSNSNSNIDFNLDSKDSNSNFSQAISLRPTVAPTETPLSQLTSSSDTASTTHALASTHRQLNKLRGGENERECFAQGGNDENSPLPGEELLSRAIEDTLEDPSDTSPIAYAKAVAVSAQAFARLATAHHTYMRVTTAERLNMHGVPATFAIGDRVKIYVPPTHQQMLATGRRAKHIVAWRGPCTITRILSRTSYEMTEDCSDRVFQRTLVNIRPFRSTRDAPPPHHDRLSNEPLITGHLIAIRDEPDGRFRLATVVRVDEATVTIHYHGTTNPDLARATFRPAWNNPTDDTLALRPTQPRGHSPWLGVLDTEDLQEVIIASNLSLTSGLRLKKESATILFHLREQLFVH